MVLGTPTPVLSPSLTSVLAASNANALIAVTEAGIATTAAASAVTSANTASTAATTASGVGVSVTAALLAFRSAYLGAFATDAAAAAFATAQSITLSNGIQYENTTESKIRTYITGTGWNDYDSTAQAEQASATLSATNAATSATNAAASASSASASATSAATSATSAGTSATNAGTSATAAAASAAATAVALASLSGGPVVSVAGLTGVINLSQMNTALGLAVASGKTLTVSNTMTLNGTDGLTFTMPPSSATLVGLTQSQAIRSKTHTLSTLDSSPVGATTPSTGAFTTLSATGSATFAAVSTAALTAASVTISPSGAGATLTLNSPSTSYQASLVFESAGVGAWQFGSAGTADPAMFLWNIGTSANAWIIDAVTNIMAFTVSPTAPTPTLGDNSLKIATTAFVSAAINAVTILPLTPWSITGLLPTSMTGTSTTASIAISAGSCTDATSAQNLTYAGGTVGAGTGINTLGVATLANSTTYHVYLVKGGSGTGIYASTTFAMAPTSAPTGYQTYVRRLFSFTTSAAGAPNAYTANERDGGSYIAFLATPILDLNAVSPGNVARTLYAMSVPTGLKVQWQGRGAGGASPVFVLTSPDEPDFAVSTTAAPLADAQVYGLLAFHALITDTSARIGARSSTGTIYLATNGWIDARRS